MVNGVNPHVEMMEMGVGFLLTTLAQCPVLGVVRGGVSTAVSVLGTADTMETSQHSTTHDSSPVSKGLKWIFLDSQQPGLSRDLEGSKDTLIAC